MSPRYRKRLTWQQIGEGRQETSVYINGVIYVARIKPATMLHPDHFDWEIWMTTPHLDKVVGRGVARGVTGRERAVTAVRTRLGEIAEI